MESKSGHAIRATPEVHAQVVDNWFEDFVAQLRVDKIELETGTAHPEKEQAYKKFIYGSMDEVVFFGRDMSSKYFIQKMIIEFIQELAKSKTPPFKLALNHSNSHVLVWAEINNDDEDTEDKILISEAKINAKYFQHGFHMSVTIVEQRDNLKIPHHYKNLTK